MLAAGVDGRDLDRRQVVARHQHLRPADQHRHPVRGVPAGRVQLELPVGDVQASGHGQSLQRAERQRPGTLDHQLFVEGPQLALRLPRARRQALERCSRRIRARAPGTPGGRAGGPSRRGSRAARSAPGSPPGRSSPGSESSSSGSTGESITNTSASPAGSFSSARTTTQLSARTGAGDEQDVRVEGLRPHPAIR